jgi:hypothetical protein
LTAYEVVSGEVWSIHQSRQEEKKKERKWGRKG